MIKMKCGDRVTLSPVGLKMLEDEYLSIGERIHLTRVYNNGGKVMNVYPSHISVGVVNGNQVDQFEERLMPLDTLMIQF